MVEKYSALFNELDAKLPWQQSQEEMERRRQLWGQFDQNGNGYLSLTEVEKAMDDIVDLPCVLDTRPVIHNAFNAAKAKSKSLGDAT